MKITVAGVGYVGLSLAVLLAQHHEVTAITTTEKKAEMLNQWTSPIQDDEIERFFDEVKAGKPADESAFFAVVERMKQHDPRRLHRIRKSQIRNRQYYFQPGVSSRVKSALR